MTTRKSRRRFLTSKEVANELMVEPQTVARWVRDGKLQAIRTPGGQLRFRHEDVKALLEPRAS